MLQANIIVDMVNGFCTEGHQLYVGSKINQITKNISNFLEKNKHTNIFLCDTHKNNDIEFKRFPVHCLEGTEECKVIPALAEYINIQIPKNRFSGFFGTGLNQTLKNLNVSKLNIMGIYTDICVLCTVIDASYLDYQVCVYLDGTTSLILPNNEVANYMEKIYGVAIMSGM